MTASYQECHDAAVRASYAFGGPMGGWDTLTPEEQAWTQYAVDQVRANPAQDFETTYVGVLNQGIDVQTWSTNAPTLYVPFYGTMHKEAVFDALAQAALA